LIVLATYSWFDPAPAEFYEINSVHEVGHKVGITPGYTPLTLDRGRFFYVEQGHRGPHCSNGMRYDASQRSPWRGRPRCVMYGAARYHDGQRSHYNPAHDFCRFCRDAVQKQDLDVRYLPSFTTTLML
jgi:hypothetical protein